MLEARRRTRAAVRDVARQVAPGMSEEEGLELARRTLRAHGFEQDWVEPYLRFGRNTLKKYAEPPDPGIVLAPDDVWFIDVGPLWRNHECDYAESFAVGGDPERHRIVRDVRAIFDRTSRHWREACATGVELYRFAAAEAESLGWQLDPEMAGHRLGEYPHAVFHDGLLGNAEFTPSAGIVDARNPDPPPGSSLQRLLRGPAARRRRRVIQARAFRRPHARARDPAGFLARELRRTYEFAPRGPRHLARPAKCRSDPTLMFRREESRAARSRAGGFPERTRKFRRRSEGSRRPACAATQSVTRPPSPRGSAPPRPSARRRRPSACCRGRRGGSRCPRTPRPARA